MATKRVTAGEIQSAFAAFVATAKRLGFDVTGWSLVPMDVASPWSLVKLEIDNGSRHYGPTPFPQYVGATSREAYERLTSWTQALHAVEVLRQNDATLPVRVQRYPGDKWRWIMGGRYGRSYCDLYRIPADGSSDFGTYDSIECGTRKRAMETVGRLNESLRMGGMLGVMDNE